MFSVYHPSSPSSHGGRGRRWRQSGSAPPAPIDITAWIVSATGAASWPRPTALIAPLRLPANITAENRLSRPDQWGDRLWTVGENSHSGFYIHYVYYTGGFRPLIRINKITQILHFSSNPNIQSQRNWEINFWLRQLLQWVPNLFLNTHTILNRYNVFLKIFNLMSKKTHTVFLFTKINFLFLWCLKDFSNSENGRKVSWPYWKMCNLCH